MSTAKANSPARTHPRTPRAVSGVHLLRSRSVIRSLIASSGVGPGHLVLDLGAGPGTLTGPLAATGARILAVERNPAFVRRLHRRFDGRENVRVVRGDLRTLPLPSRPYRVVASIPFNLSTALFRRMLDPLRRSLHGGDLVVEWGFAKRVTAAVPRDLEVAWWAARYDIEIVRRIPADRFAPMPSVDCAHLRVRPRPGMFGREVQRRLRSLLGPAYRGRAPLRTVEQWAELAGRQAGNRVVRSPHRRRLRPGSSPFEADPDRRG